MEKLCIGKIIKPQGLRGELKVASETDVPAVFSGIKTVFIDGKEHKVLHFNFRLGFAYLQIEGVSRIEEAEPFRNKKVFVYKNVFESMDDNSYLVADLIGMNLIDEEGKESGIVEDVEGYGATDILIIRADGRAYQVPFIGAIFLNVNKSKREILISKEQFKNNRISG